MMDLSKELQGTFHIVQTVSDRHEISLRVSENWSYFLGHFPHLPILPAVAVVDFTQFFVNECYGKNCMAKVQNMRLKQSIHPRENLVIVLKKESEQNFHVLWKKDDETIKAELHLQMF